MSDTISIPKSYLDNLQNEITDLKKLVGELVEQFQEFRDPEPKAGTKAWWVWAERQADKDIKAGNTITLKNKDEINRFFDEL